MAWTRSLHVWPKPTAPAARPAPHPCARALWRCHLREQRVRLVRPPPRGLSGRQDPLTPPRRRRRPWLSRAGGLWLLPPPAPLCLRLLAARPTTTRCRAPSCFDVGVGHRGDEQRLRGVGADTVPKGRLLDLLDAQERPLNRAHTHRRRADESNTMAIGLVSDEGHIRCSGRHTGSARSLGTVVSSAGPFGDDARGGLERSWAG